MSGEGRDEAQVELHAQLARDREHEGVGGADGGIALREWGQRAGYLVDLDGTQLHLIEDDG